MMKRYNGVGLGILYATGRNTVQYIHPRSWAGYLFFLKGRRDRKPAVHWVEQSSWALHGSNSWHNKMAPYPPDYLNQGYQLTISEIQDVLERNGKRHPLDL